MLNLSRKSVTWMVLSVVLFIALSPGVLLTVPSMDGTLASMWTPNVPSGQVVVHAIVFALALNIVGGALKRAGVIVRRSRSSPRSSPRS